MTKGKITRIIHEKNEFKIGIFKINHSNQKSIKFIGSLPDVHLYEEIEVQGYIKHHEKYGSQLYIQSYQKSIPNQMNSIVRFLQTIKGIGKIHASRIYDKWREETIDKLLRADIEEIASIKGISQNKAKQIQQSVKNNYGLHELMKQLKQIGVPDELFIKARKKMKDKVFELQDNPYLLMRYELCSFPSADRIAKQIGIKEYSKLRIEHAIWWILHKESVTKGHTYVEEKELSIELVELLNDHSNSTFTYNELFPTIAEIEATTSSPLIYHNNKYYLKHLYYAEKDVGQSVSQRVNRQVKIPPRAIEKKIKKYEHDKKIELAEQQRQAIKQFYLSPFMILTGGPGTGKTYTVQTIIDMLKYDKQNVGIAAPTGQAAKNIGNDATTIHRMIGLHVNRQPTYHIKNQLDYDVVIIDEVSMTDIVLAKQLLDAIPLDTKILLVGDPDQLPSVKAGNFLQNLLKTKCPHVKLIEIFRQAKDSQIVANAYRINEGKSLEVDQSKNDYYIIEETDPKRTSLLIEKSVQRFIQKGYSIDDIMVLTPMKKTDVGTFNLNRRLQNVLNPNEVQKVYGKTFKIMDKVMFNQNNPELEIYNGDIGRIIGIEDNKIICAFGNRNVTIEGENIFYLELCYASTIHKSQGSQAKVVIIGLTDQHNIMLARNLLYTAQTRAEKVCVLIGSPQAMDKAIKNKHLTNRRSTLHEFINLR